MSERLTIVSDVNLTEMRNILRDFQPEEKVIKPLEFIVVEIIVPL